MRDDYFMRTTIDIDDDMIRAAKAVARQRRITLGQAVSAQLRKSFQPGNDVQTESYRGFKVLPRRGLAEPITSEFINRLRDEAE
jgi:Arc/MetJ family transcription regulator